MNRAEWMKGICHLWSRGRHFSPSLPGDRYLNLSSPQKRPPGRNLGEHRSVRRSGTASRGTAFLAFCLRMRRFLKTQVLTIFMEQYSQQARSQGLSSLPPLVVGTETLVTAGHVTIQNLGGRKICWKGGGILSSSRPNVLEYPPTRDQPQPGSLIQRLREAEKRDPGNEVVFAKLTFRALALRQSE